MLRRTLAVTFFLFVSATIFSISQAQYAYHFYGYVYDAAYSSKLNNVSLTIYTELDTLQMTTNAAGYYAGEFISTSVLLPALPTTFDLISQNYPNPFNPTTTIQYAGPGRLEVFDVTGKLVGCQELKIGSARLNLPLASGVYFYRFTALNGMQRTRKMLLLDGSHAELHLIGSATGSARLERTKILTAELPARFVIEKPDYGAIDTMITLVSDQTNRHDFVLRMFNYPPVTNVPNITVDKNGPNNVALSRYVKDPDNAPSEMTWNVTDYDTSLVSIIIEGDTAKITNNDTNGSTAVTWIATDPAGAAGQNTGQIQVNPLYKLTIVLEDPINGSRWGLMPLNLVGKNQNSPLISGIDGSVIAYTKSDTGRVIVPISETVWETVQRYKGLTKDDTLVVPVTGKDFLLPDFTVIQGIYPGSIEAYTSHFDPKFITQAVNPVDPDTLRMAYYFPSQAPAGSNSNYAALRNKITAWNSQYFAPATRGTLVMQPPQMGLNAEMYTPTSMDDETAKNIALNDTSKALLNDAGMYWLVTYFGQGQGGAVPLVTENDPFIQRGMIHTMYNNGDGALFAEALTHLTSDVGEPHTPPWQKTVYQGVGYQSFFTQIMYYNGVPYVPEVLVGDFKFNPMMTPGTKTTKTTIQPRIIDFSNK